MEKINEGLGVPYMKSKVHQSHCERDCWGPVESEKQLEKLREEWGGIVKRSKKVSHPLPFVLMEVSELLGRMVHQANIIFIHSKYCEKHYVD